METIKTLIPVNCFTEFVERMKNLIAKCERLELTPPQYSTGKITAVEFTNENGEKNWVEAYRVEVHYEEIRLPGGWKVLASIEYGEDGWNIINGKLDNIQEYKQMALRCDHCQSNRYRKKVIVVENNNKERKVVGTDCVKDYLGVSVSDAVFACGLEKYIFDLCNPKIISEAEYDGGGYGFRVQPSIDIEQAAISCACVMREMNWVYKKDFPDAPGTKSFVSALVYDLISVDSSIRKSAEERIEEADKNNATRFLQALSEKFPESKLDEFDQSFDYMVALMLKTKRVWFKKMGIFIGAFGYLISQLMQKEAIRCDPKLSEFIGNVGDKKVELDIVWDRFRFIESDYNKEGCLICSGHVNETNNCITWFRSGDKEDGLVTMKDGIPEVDGKVVPITATIKAHKDEGQYGKKTIIKMVKERK